MARKVAKPEPGQASAPSGADASRTARELQTLHPTATMKLRGRTLKVREYGYIEGLHVQAAAQPFLDMLYHLVDRASAPPPAAAVRKVFALNAQAMKFMIGQAITPENDEDPQAFLEAMHKNAAWVGRLNDVEGDALTAVWWGVNGGFFTRRIRELALAAREAAATASPSTPEGSTQP